MTETIACEPTGWLPTLAGLREDGYAFFDFLTAVDQGDDAGFEVVTHLYRFMADATSEIFVSTGLEPGQSLLTITGLWRGAAWHERETYEMFGIVFDGFDDGTGLGLRPLLLPDAFEGNPLRKDFVLTARASKPWPGAKDPSDATESRDVRPGRAPRRKTLPPGVPPASWGPR
ncbi:NADH-quinone oxidoreductase subunit C [Branchiibius sp. NY16-3462-2]|uniref:NADH-quinone oxidoreductase subunit C n=1 Tax=Branchiibius sp. NY16-3462-2 TaxID=1807500 RepID=UPI00079623C8|nr:NADH-quinone oxidoreductase subunit C [Branchiibius sp. NY16-3462-2]KYH46159.1 NADH dehydrogenase [Branchiibius sp. NY16-3462-2]